MQYRLFGRLGWKVSEIGHGMWGMGGQWKGSTDQEAITSLKKSFELGCNFYDTAWIYGQGHSERLFKEALSSEHKKNKLYVATKIPPKNMQWPGKAEYDVKDVFPKEHIIEYAYKSIENLGVKKIDLLQLHVWDDSWTVDDGWKEAVDQLKREKLIEGFGISVNKWESENVLEAINTDLIDAVQVVYNIFEQAPEDNLLPVCLEKNIAVIARVPFDEGSLTGTLNRNTVFETGDWRAKFFSKEMLMQSMDRVDKIRAILPSGSNLSDIALKYILKHDAISTVIPGMRKTNNVEKNIAVSDGTNMDEELYKKLKTMRWDRSTSEFGA
jgi:aryl-alcohol dehydrogenase-like predicted oxidoreductase